MSEDDIWDQITINTAAALGMTRIIVPKMQDQRRGAIINIASIAGLRPMPLMSVYSASKVLPSCQIILRILKHFYEKSDLEREVWRSALRLEKFDIEMATAGRHQP